MTREYRGSSCLPATRAVSTCRGGGVTRGVTENSQSYPPSPMLVSLSLKHHRCREGKGSGVLHTGSLERSSMEGLIPSPPGPLRSGRPLSVALNRPVGGCHLRIEPHIQIRLAVHAPSTTNHPTKFRVDCRERVQPPILWHPLAQGFHPGR